LVSSADDLAGFAVDATASLTLTFGIAFVSHQMVEQPAVNAARHLEWVVFTADNRRKIAATQKNEC
jgi:peptidoglycan/LPS O-acetylase OafA/YrhL